MPTNRKFSTALQALTEVKTESSTSASGVKPIPESAPALRDVLAQTGPLPLEALFLGVASDQLPVLLNLYDPHPGPLLIAGDAGSGKTAFLQTIAQSLALTHSPNDVQFGVITNYPDEWERIEASPHRVGVFAVGQKSAQEFVQSLASWAHSNKNTHQCVLLLVDDLESVATLEPETVQSFRWLLLRGPARRVWPVTTLNAPRYGQVVAWLPNFRTRIFGRVANARVAEALGGDKASVLSQLEAGIQFSLRETIAPRAPGGKDNWLRFWLPSC
ncbi:MAG TPA: FtsK/SpoIIIE domain-containing protein [Anaerolineales bacterium]